MSDEDLVQVCGELASWLAVAETLVALPDLQPSGRRAGKPGSKAPGNTAVVNAIMDAHAGVRQIESELRVQVTHGRATRGGSTRNTLVALEAIPILSGALDVVHVRENGKPCRCQHCEAIRALGRWALAIRQLPAIDDAPRWVKLRPGPGGLPPQCPFCETFSLRLAVESGQIRCWFPGCADEKGNPNTATVEISRVGGVPVLVWSQGVVQLWPPV